jgi:CelD/BcsL family acetyltransferase involved in cellulose biosynthesis
MSGLVVTHQPAELVRDGWDALADELGGSPFLRPGWVLRWHEAFGRAPLRVYTAYDDGRLVGVLPVQARLGFVASPTNDHTPEFGVLATGDGARDALLGAALAAGRGQCRLSHLDEATAGAVLAVAGRRGARTLSKAVLDSPYVLLDGDFETFFASLSRNTRSQVRRRRRQLAEVGDLELDVHRVPDPEAMAEFFRLEASEWKAAEGTALSQRPAEQAFYREVAAWAADRGWLRLALLRVGGRAVAADLSLQAAGVRYLLKTGYDVELARFSPGRVLRHDEIVSAFDEGLERYELLGGADEWKLSWTDTTRRRIRVHVFGPGPGGALLAAAQTHGRRAAGWVRQVRAG